VQALVAVDVRFQDIAENIPALVAYVGADERYQFVNKAYEEWFQVRREVIVGAHMKEVLGADAYKVLAPNIRKVLTGCEVEFETGIKYRTGSRFIRASYVPDRGTEGQEVIGFYVLVNDISELKRSERARRSAESRYKVLTESFKDYAIISTDVYGTIQSWNIGAELIFGYEDHEVIGRSSEMLFTPEDVAIGVPGQEMETARRFGRANDERWHIRKDGSRFFAQGVLSPLYIDKRLEGYAMIAVDRTDLKRNAELLQNSHDQMENMVRERTSELQRTNRALVEESFERLQAEKQRAGLLERLVTTQEDERSRIARDIHDHLGQRFTALRLKLASLSDIEGIDPAVMVRVNRLQEIAQDLDSDLSFLAWRLRPLALDELGLVEAIRTFVSEWSRHYEIAAEFHEIGIGSVRLIPDAETHVYRILQEALNNVAKHARADMVNVIIERSRGTLVLIVEDDGIGFSRPETVVKGEVSGGLGLQGMSERAELIGAKLEIETQPGQGTTVYLRIPEDVNDG
jgi:PAS domain S-box-containing protein